MAGSSSSGWTKWGVGARLEATKQDLLPKAETQR